MSAAIATRIDLNADVGEGFPDEELMPFISSASIACGAHAGDETTMRATLRLTARYGVAAGAHPGFPDRAGFGRAVTPHDPGQIEEMIADQLRALVAIATEEGIALRHVKPHGALYNLAAREADVAAAVARGIRRCPAIRLVYGLAGSRLVDATRSNGLVLVAEGFADRGYALDGTLVPRGTPGALIHDPDEAARRAVAIVAQRSVTAACGRQIALDVNTLCLHGDTAGAAAIARAVHQALRAAGIAILAPNP